MIGTMGTNRVKGVDQSDTENQRPKGYLNGIKRYMHAWVGPFKNQECIRVGRLSYKKYYLIYNLILIESRLN